MFNDYLVDIGKKIAESTGGNNNNHLDYMTNINQPNSFSVRPINCYSTENKSSNLNTIPVKNLKSICDIISHRRRWGGVAGGQFPPLFDRSGTEYHLSPQNFE